MGWPLKPENQGPFIPTFNHSPSQHGTGSIVQSPLYPFILPGQFLTGDNYSTFTVPSYAFLPSPMSSAHCSACFHCSSNRGYRVVSNIYTFCIVLFSLGLVNECILVLRLSEFPSCKCLSESKTTTTNHNAGEQGNNTGNGQPRFHFVAMSSSISIYLQYKLRTGYVLSWLVSTALTTDCPKSLLPSAQSQSRTIPTAIIVPIAEWIEQSDQTCRVPRSVLNDLGQAIDLRTRYSQTLRGDGALTATDRSHDHFLNTLKDLKTVLHRINSATSTSPRGSPKRNTTNVTSSQFSALSLEETTSDNEVDEEERQAFLSTVGKLDTTS